MLSLDQKPVEPPGRRSGLPVDMIDARAARPARHLPLEPIQRLAIALDNGFWELGRFAVEYKRLFGESPSETLAAS